ncbi:RICIN domain-containing protein [Streptomyces sp. MK5]|uniref:RICIN domain-containing protein n=1 Tax=Streptomyces sp. MK5 TaxID=3064253 RepID=UPI002740D259|nr:RICIN domain-containing protein [Streptomyces sp. MK5]
MKDPGLSHSPEPPGPFDATDQQLSTELSKWTGATPALRPVGQLLDRHWEAAFAYARLCTDGPHPAGMLTTASFTRLFGQTLRQAGPTAAWRPQLLITVRRIAAEWAADHRREMLHPELRAAAADDRIAARLLPAADRRLLPQAFQRLPQTARALLWHADVEAEPLAVPARLLGIDEEDARVGLRRARERLREECLQAHRELAPEQDCLRYFRLLDVTWRRGGVDIDPDLREHLARCTHCRYTADQLARFDDGLGTALAEGVLGWGAREYRESRAAGAAPPAEDGSLTPPPSTAFVGGEDFTTAPPGASAGAEGFGAYGRPGMTPSGGDAFGTVPPGGPAPRRPARPAPSDRGRRRARPAEDAAVPPAAGSTGAESSGGRASGRPDGFALFDRARRGARTAGGADVPTGAGGAGMDSSGGPASGQWDAFVPFGRARHRARPATESFVPPGASGAESGSASRAVPGRNTAGASGARRSAHRAARRAVRRRNLAIAVATVSGLVVLPLALWSVLGSGDDDAPGSGRQPSGTPGPSSGTASPGSSPGSSWAGAGGAGKSTLRGRLHNVASGLCVGIVGGKAVKGAETELTTCSSAPGQQWAYESDGLLRSGAAPGLCLDSHLGWSVQLATCPGASAPGARNVRYDFTLQGTLVPRFDQDLALTPAATDGAGALVLKTRARSDTQRWAIDPAAPELQMDVADWIPDGGASAHRTAGR